MQMHHATHGLANFDNPPLDRGPSVGLHLTWIGRIRTRDYGNYVVLTTTPPSMNTTRQLWMAAIACFACMLSPDTLRATQVNYEMVTVGDPGNIADSTGYGAVPYEYRIGKYEVTVGQYAVFLNAVANSDPHSLWHASMAGSSGIAGISRSGLSGSYTYSLVGSSTHPIDFIGWIQAARFANWMSNGQPSGPAGPATTEDGAYRFTWTGDVQNLNTINPNTGLAPSFFIPTENEWYKAAYYSPQLNGGAGGYYLYATQSSDTPGNRVGGLSNQANWNNGVFSVTQQSTQYGTEYTSEVGAFVSSASYYGTFDQTGNVWEHNDASRQTNSRGLRGGGWRDGYFNNTVDPYRLMATHRGIRPYGFGRSDDIGFRLASPVLVPEPSTYAMALAGLACGGYLVRRRHKRA